MEKLVELWESAFSIQVPNKTRNLNNENKSDSRAIVLGNEDFLMLLTSCIICVVKSEKTMLDHLMQWGFVQV
jgi:hypothetical protein